MALALIVATMMLAVSKVSWGDVPTWVSATLAFLGLMFVIVAAVFARGQLSEAKTLRREQLRPYVFVDIEPNQVTQTFLDIIVGNCGQTGAYDITFEFRPPLGVDLRSLRRAQQPVGYRCRRRPGGFPQAMRLKNRAVGSPRVFAANRLVPVVLFAVALAGCNANDDNAPSGEEPAPIPTASETELPMNAFLPSPEEQNAFTRVLDALAADCLQARGYVYPAQLPNENAPPAYPRQGYWGIFDLHYSARFGFVVEGSESAAARSRALSEAMDDATAGGVDIETFGRDSEECYREAAEGVYATDDDGNTYQDLHVHAWNFIAGPASVAVESDSRVIEAYADWSRCVAEAGYAGFRTPSELGSNPAWYAELADAAPVATPAGIEAAVTSARCADELSLRALLLSIEAGYQQRVIGDHQSEFDLLARLRIESVENAERLLAAGL